MKYKSKSFSRFSRSQKARANDKGSFIKSASFRGTGDRKVSVEYEGEEEIFSLISQFLEKSNLKEVEYIYIMPLQKLIEMGDEMIEFRLVKEKNIAMNRGRDEPDASLEILVAIDHPSLVKHLKKLRKQGWTEDNIKKERAKQIVLSILHEEGHLEGIDNEEEAEDFAQDRFYDIYTIIKEGYF